jgi:hypothetical protein
MKNTLTKIATAVSVATIAGNASAGTITQSISLNQLLSGGASYSGSFALSPLLAAQDLSGGTFTGATLSAYGFSDTQINQSAYMGYSEQYVSGSWNYVAIGSYSYSCGWAGWSTCYGTRYGYAAYNNYNAYDYYEQRDTVADTMRLSSGTASVADTVDHTGSGPSVQYTGGGSRGNGTYGYDYINHYNSTTTSVYSGALFAELSLGASDLLRLAQAGQFDYLVQATVGNFRLTGLSMTVNVDPAAIPHTGNVPEPASSLLVLGGLAGLAAAARRQRRERNTQS